ncbi:cell cycle checkpoint control protein family [Striga asiatica]|uniref:Cell cycle checkpoint control protein family n=1 Tax=Striga asiatica TaxID=4170 RepID=A0A5A7QRM8_STRAF|nr:cell cycle checkpoint control protein family [Striga asiatica]
MRLTLLGSLNLLPYLLNPIAECLRLRPICFIPEFHFTWTLPKRTKGKKVVYDQLLLLSSPVDPVPHPARKTSKGIHPKKPTSGKKTGGSKRSESKASPSESSCSRKWSELSFRAGNGIPRQCDVNESDPSALPPCFPDSD